MKSKTKEQIKLKVSVDNDGVSAIIKEANKLMNKVNYLRDISKPFGKIEIKNVSDILPSVQSILDGKLNNSTGVTHRGVALLLGLEAEYLRLVKYSEDLLNSFLYRRYARFLNFNPKNNIFELHAEKLQTFAIDQCSTFVYGEKSIELFKQTERFISDYMELLEVSKQGDGLRQRQQFSNGIGLVNIDNTFTLFPNTKLISELTA